MSDTGNTKRVNRRRRKAIRRITIRLTTCDEMTLRRIARAGKVKSSEVIRDLIRTAGQVFEVTGDIAKAAGISERAATQGLYDAVLKAANDATDGRASVVLDDRREENLALSEVAAARKVGDQEAA